MAEAAAVTDAARPALVCEDVHKSFGPLEVLKGVSLTANQGDVIYVLPGHTETVANATTIVPDVAGISIIGLGRGTARPTITFTNASGNIPISADNIVLENIHFTISGTTDVTAGITITGEYALLKNITMKQSAATAEFVDGVVLATGGDYSEIDGFEFDGVLQGGSTQTAISITAALKNVRIRNVWAVATAATGIIENVSNAAVDLVIENVVLEQRHSSRDECIMTTTTTTGFIINAVLRTATDDTAGMDAISGDLNMQLYNIGIVNADAEVATMDHTDLFVTDNTATTNFPFNASMV